MFSSSVIKKIGYYIYLHIHPETNEIFYVGMGKGNRAFQHLKDESETEKTAIIKKLKSQGKKPEIDILIHGLDLLTARKVEAAVIDLLGKDNLSNLIRGWGAGSYGRMPYKELISMLAKERANIVEPSILIRINKLYRFGMTPMELYDVTRGRWKVGKKRYKAQYAFSVYDGVIKEVYEIKHWLAAGSTMSTRMDTPSPERWEFVGSIAESLIRVKYKDKSVAHYFSRRAQNPIRYINIE